MSDIGCGLLIFISVGGIWILGTIMFFFTEHIDDEFAVLYAICSSLMGWMLLACWYNSEDIDKAKENLSEKKTQLKKLKEQKKILIK